MGQLLAIISGIRASIDPIALADSTQASLLLSGFPAINQTNVVARCPELYENDKFSPEQQENEGCQACQVRGWGPWIVRSQCHIYQHGWVSGSLVRAL